MECTICKVEKLPNEFPPEPITDKCNHAQFYCMKCVLKVIKCLSRCPHPECAAPTTLKDPKPRLLQATLDAMFREYTTDSTAEVVHPQCQSGTLTITLLTGQTLQLPYDPNMRVAALKKEIQKKLNHETYKQKLLYNDVEITLQTRNGPWTMTAFTFPFVALRQTAARLIDFGVQPNSSLFLVIVLLAIPETFDDVVFDLHWGYPSTGPDYLDASCLIFFSGQSQYAVVDYRTRPVMGGAIQHSGDVMDDLNRIGHHTINVSLKKIPPEVTHLFFTLSAWNSPNISRFPNPSLKFYETERPLKDLCKTTFTHANHSQAVIMCSVSRGNNGGWKIFESGKLSSGNAKKYSPLAETIQSLIAKGI